MRPYIVSAQSPGNVPFSVRQAKAVYEALASESVLCDHLTSADDVIQLLTSSPKEKTLLHMFWPPPSGLAPGHLLSDMPLVVTLWAPDVSAALHWLGGRNGNTVFAANDSAALGALRRAGHQAVLIHPALPDEAFVPPEPCARRAARAGLSPDDAVVFLFSDAGPDGPMPGSGVSGCICTAEFDSPQWPRALLSADVIVHLAPHLTPALVEASARGCAILGVESPETGSIFTGGIAAVFVPAGDQAALESAMLQLMSSPLLCESVGEQARLAAAERFDAAVVAEQYRELYDNLPCR